MKPLNYLDVKSWDDATLAAKVRELRVQLFEMRMSAHSVKMKKPHAVKVAKKNIARLMTAVSERKNASAKI